MKHFAAMLFLVAVTVQSKPSHGPTLPPDPWSDAHVSWDTTPQCNPCPDAR